MTKKETLAYLIGIAIGDGNLSNPNGRAVRLRISCDTNYPILIRKICKAVHRIIPKNKVSLIKTQARCVDISCYSNKWPLLLGWSVGSKQSQQVHIPRWITFNTQYATACLRGLIETDGTIYKDRGYLAVMFTTTISKLAYEVYEIVQSLGFQPRKYIIKLKNKDEYTRQTRYNIRLTRDVVKFLEVVQPIKK